MPYKDPEKARQNALERKRRYNLTPRLCSLCHRPSHYPIFFCGYWMAWTCLECWSEELYRGWVRC
jgi:hypothetical protein